MGNSRAKSAGWSEGELITPAQINQIDSGQAKAFVNDGTTTLAAHCTITMADKNLTISATSGVVTLPTWPTVSLALVDRRIPFSPCIQSAKWEGGFGGYWVDLVNGGGNGAALLLDLPLGFQISSFKLEVRGATTGILPAAKAVASLYKYAVGAYDSGSLLGSQTDSSGNNAAYVANHTIVISGLSEVVSDSAHYMLHLNVPSDAQAVAGFRIYRAFATGLLSLVK